MKDRKKPRRLREEEEAIWKRVAATVRPTGRGKAPSAPGEPAPAAAPAEPGAPAPPPIAPFSIGDRARTSTAAYSVTPAGGAAPKTLNLDRRAFTRLKRGQLRPEARLDLHGMTLAQAKPALSRFLGEAEARGLRLVLVITGKGQARDDWGPVPERPGILKQTVPAWLSADPAVLEVTEAHRKHGGGGAYYVYMRRRR